MDCETIIFNECRNDLSAIHLYYSAAAELWQAFGASAYRLDELVTGDGIPHLTGYSLRLMMPSVALRISELKRVAVKYGFAISESQDHVEIPACALPAMIDRNGYTVWARRLHDTCTERNNGNH